MTSFMADFETTSYAGQEFTEVWASAIFDLSDELEIENVIVDNSIMGLMKFILNYPDDTTTYFHNLKFDGTFILYWLVKIGFEEASFVENKVKVLEDKKTFKKGKDSRYRYTISDRGVWYAIEIKYNGHVHTILDSLKLLPFSVKEIGKAFKTKFQKTSIEYTGYRQSYGIITAEEKEYIANDVLVVAEALNILFSQGHNKSTIGANCLAEYKMSGDMATEKNLYRKIFPDLYKVECPVDDFKNVDEYIRKSYKGGWCYLKRGCENILYTQHITVCDVNSLYPSMMHSNSGNVYPYGKPIDYFIRDIPEWIDETYSDGRRKYYYFIRIRTKFQLKKNCLPTVMIKGSVYPAREWLESSNITKNGRTYTHYIDENGDSHELKPTLTLTYTDWELMKKHYDLIDLEILDGVVFNATIGLFDEYINKWAEVKENSTGAIRTLAKLFLTNLYGKMASSDESSYKTVEIQDGLITTSDVEAHDKQPGNIAVGSAITSYAREFTIKAAQSNYENFLYADTDSIHCKCYPENIKNAPEHPTKFNHWKYEAEADTAIYVRAKRYIEHVIKENHETVEPYYNIKCAGMGKQCKDIVNNKLKNGTMQLSEFKSGLTVSGNLKAKNINGGIVLVEQDFHLH